MDPLERKKLFCSVVGNDEYKFIEHEKCIKSLPLVKLSIKAYVHGADDIVVGDTLTCKFRVEFINLEKGGQSGYVHSKHYPYLRRDTWYLIITDPTLTGIASIEKFNIDEDYFEKEYTERLYRPGAINFLAILANDCYRGLD